MIEIKHKAETLKTLEQLNTDCQKKDININNDFLLKHNDRCPCCRKKIVNRNNEVVHCDNLSFFTTTENFLFTFVACNQCNEAAKRSANEREDYWRLNRIVRKISRTIKNQ